jgi:2-oxoglutarate dehydrogenase E1 component
LSGNFNEVLTDAPKSAQKLSTAVLMSGKIFYDVQAALKKAGIENVALIRLEQLYPFPAEALKSQLAGLKSPSFYWVQEEPKNMGAWTFADARLREELGIQARYVGRPESATTAAGSHKYNGLEQNRIVEELIALIKK